MKILIISKDYYPDLTPNTYRWQAIAEFWSKKGHEVYVLAPFRREIPVFKVEHGVRVYRKGNSTLLDWAYNLFRIQQRRNRINQSTTIKGNEQKYWKIGLNKLVSLTWRNIYWPDGSCIWYFPAKRKAFEIIEEEEIDVLISVCLPFTCTLIAKACKTKFPSIKWISDIEDPFSILSAQPKNNHSLYKHMNFRAEASTIKQADAISLTVESARMRYIDAFGFAEKMQVIPPLFNDQLATQKTAFDLIFETDKINIVYFGAFYFGIRAPDEFLLLLDRMLNDNPRLKEKIRVHFFGEIQSEFKVKFDQFPNLASNLIFHGLISRAMVFQRMQEADFLLNIANKTTYQLPSKCVDYYYSGKPIINISYHDLDTFDSFFEDYPLYLGLNLAKMTNLSDQIASFTLFLEQQKGRLVPKPLIEKKLLPYQIEAIATKYLALLK